MQYITRLALPALLPLALLAPLAQAECVPDIPPSTPDSDFKMHANGTVTHKPTGLMWMRCALGQRWDESASSCVGSSTLLTWQNALAAVPDLWFAGYNDWRLPNAKELASIVELSCHTPAVNRSAFPGTISDAWTSTARREGGTAGAEAFRVRYNTDGQVWVSPKTTPLAVRPVRAGRGFFAKQGGLNDTGIDWWANADTNFLTTSQPDFPGQDAEFGRDAKARAVTLTKIGGGAAGFDFTKLGENGEELPADATAWSCVRDNVTGLIWEIKTEDGGLRNKNHTFSWYSTDANSNGGDAGTEGDVSTCDELGNCNTQAYVAAVNALETKLCGFGDWRLPTVDELLSIVHNGLNTPPLLDTAYFPDAGFASGTFVFWSSSPRADDPAHAWAVGFGDGDVGSHAKSHGRRVRLVRAGQ